MRGSYSWGIMCASLRVCNMHTLCIIKTHRKETNIITIKTIIIIIKEKLPACILLTARRCIIMTCIAYARVLIPHSNF